MGEASKFLEMQGICAGPKFLFIKLGKWRRSYLGGREEHPTLVNKSETEGFLAQKGLWDLAKNKELQDRGVLPKEEGDVVRENKAMHEEHFLSCWLKKGLA